MEHRQTDGPAKDGEKKKKEKNCVELRARRSGASLRASRDTPAAKVSNHRLSIACRRTTGSPASARFCVSTGTSIPHRVVSAPRAASMGSTGAVFSPQRGLSSGSP